MLWFLCSTARHELPADFRQPNNPWKALQSKYAHPYILTCDTFGIANNLWSIEPEGSEALRLITSLKPLLPATARLRRLTHFANTRILVVEFDDPKGRRNENGALRAYAVDDGRMIHEVELPGVFAQAQSQHSADLLAVPVLDDRRRPQVIIYTLTAEGLQEMDQVCGDTTVSGSGDSEESLIPLHVAEDGGLLTSSTSIPSTTLELAFHQSDGSSQITLSPGHEPSDCLEPTAIVLTSPSSFALAIRETDSATDFHPHSSQSTIHCVALPLLSPLWQTPLPYKVTRLSHHPSLRVFVALGSRYEDGKEAVFSITFLDEQDGGILKEETFPYPGGGEKVTAKCTSGDDLVAVFETGKLLISSLKPILSDGLSRNEAGGVITQVIPVRPEPVNARTRKAGDRWKWIDHVIICSKILVLFPVRGPEVYALRW